MSKSRLIEYQKNYLFQCYAGNNEGTIGKLLDKYWKWRLDRMTEGEILDRYYELTNKPTEYRIGDYENE